MILPKGWDRMKMNLDFHPGSIKTVGIDILSD